MHYLTRRFRFSASHRLWNASLSDTENQAAFGMCTNIHGHNYVLEVTIEGKPGPQTGFSCNVLSLKDVVDRLIVDPCEHHFLNDIPLFAGVVPTTMENLSQRIWEVLDGELAAQGLHLYEILLAETEDNIVRLRRSL